MKSVLGKGRGVAGKMDVDGFLSAGARGGAGRFRGRSMRIFLP